MPDSSTPTPRNVERALVRLTADQFGFVCAEIGLLEITLPGNNQAQKAAALVQKTQGQPDFVSLVRAINRTNPDAWRARATRRSLSSGVISLIAFVAFLGLGGFVLFSVLSGSEPPPPPTDTATSTLPPTRTPVPTFTVTSSPTPIPSDTPTPTATETSTRAPVVATETVVIDTATPTETPIPAPEVLIFYAQVEPQLPPSGYGANTAETVEFRWLLREGPIAGDERYLMRIYAADDGTLADTFLSSDTWRFAVGGPFNATGDFFWTVSVVRVDEENNVIAFLNEEGGAWNISWQP